MRRRLNLQAVIFDMDGVITDTMPYHLKAWKRALHNEEGFSVSYEEIYCREGQPGHKTVRELFQAHGRKYNPAEADKILWAKEVYFKKIARIRYVQGARRFIKRLHRKGFKLALVTGTARHEMKRILALPLRSLFDVIVTGDEVKHGKPHPEPYQKALRMLKLPAGKCVVIENAPFGILSAKKAGITCLALQTSLPRLYLKNADLIFTTFKDLITHVRFDKIDGKSNEI